MSILARNYAVPTIHAHTNTTSASHIRPLHTNMRDTTQHHSLTFPPPVLVHQHSTASTSLPRWLRRYQRRFNTFTCFKPVTPRCTCLAHSLIAAVSAFRPSSLHLSSPFHFSIMGGGNGCKSAAKREKNMAKLQKAGKKSSQKDAVKNQPVSAHHPALPLRPACSAKRPVPAMLPATCSSLAHVADSECVSVVCCMCRCACASVASPAFL